MRGIRRLRKPPTADSLKELSNLTEMIEINRAILPKEQKPKDRRIIKHRIENLIQQRARILKFL